MKLAEVLRTARPEMLMIVSSVQVMPLESAEDAAVHFAQNAWAECNANSTDLALSPEWLDWSVVVVACGADRRTGTDIGLLHERMALMPMRKDLAVQPARETLTQLPAVHSLAHVLLRRVDNGGLAQLPSQAAAAFHSEDGRHVILVLLENAPGAGRKADHILTAHIGADILPPGLVVVRSGK